MLEWRMTASAMADERSTMAERVYPPHRLPGIQVIFGANGPTPTRPKSLDEGDPPHTRGPTKSRHTDARSRELLGARGRPVSTASRWPPHVKSKRPRMGISWLLLGTRCTSTPSWCTLPRGRWCATRNTSPRSTSAVSSDGSSATAKGVRMPDGAVDLTSASMPPKTGQFERTLIIASRQHVKATWRAVRRRCATKISSTPPRRVVAHRDAQTNQYSTVQNWYPGRKGRKVWDLQLRHTSGICPGGEREASRGPGETAFGDHLEKYPS